MEETKTLCSSCSASIWCETWAEYKCTIKGRHITGRKTTCASYKKRPSNWKAIPCGCADCQKNPEAINPEDE
jgi:hypothetical protein